MIYRMDDFDSVFGEGDGHGEAVNDALEMGRPALTGHGYGSFLADDVHAKENKDNPIKMTSEEASNVIKNILSRKPPNVSPTLPKLDQNLQMDPLELDTPSFDGRGSGERSLIKRKINSQSEPSLPRMSATKRAPSASKSVANKDEIMSTPTRNTSTDGNRRRKITEIMQRMTETNGKETKSDTIDEWKGILSVLEKTETIESAKSPADPKLISSCVVLSAWISEHLVDLILKRIQRKAIINGDINVILGQLAQVSALREQTHSLYNRINNQHSLQGKPFASPWIALTPLIQDSMIYLTRVETFCASHRLHSIHLSDEENQKIYGKCNWKNGHGHNYKLELTICGGINPLTGMLINLKDLEAIIWSNVLQFLDHRNLDKDVDYFRERPSTTENLSEFIWRELVDKFPPNVTLWEIKLHETDKNYVVFRG